MNRFYTHSAPLLFVGGMSSLPADSGEEKSLWGSPKEELGSYKNRAMRS